MKFVYYTMNVFDQILKQLKIIKEQLESRTTDVRDLTDSVPNSNPSLFVSENPEYEVLNSGDSTTIPDDLISYSIYNMGPGPMLINGVSIPSGVIVSERQELRLGKLRGVEVNALTSTVLISKKSKN